MRKDHFSLYANEFEFYDVMKYWMYGCIKEKRIEF